MKDLDEIREYMVANCKFVDDCKKHCNLDDQRFCKHYEAGMMIINRIWAMPNKWTFQIQPIKELVSRYVGDGKGWIDPFAGMTSPAEITNDLNPECPAKYHMDALDFLKQLDGQYKGVLFDPPYSAEQCLRKYIPIQGGRLAGRNIGQGAKTKSHTKFRLVVSPFLFVGTVPALGRNEVSSY